MSKLRNRDTSWHCPAVFFSVQDGLTGSCRQSIFRKVRARELVPSWCRIGAGAQKSITRRTWSALRDLSADPASVVKGPAVHRFSGRALQRADLGGEVADPRGNGGTLDAARSFCAGRVRLFARASGWELSDLWREALDGKDTLRGIFVAVSL